MKIYLAGSTGREIDLTRIPFLSINRLFSYVFIFDKKMSFGTENRFNEIISGKINEDISCRVNS